MVFLHTCSILNNSNLVCWGSDFYMQLGIDVLLKSNTPIKSVYNFYKTSGFFISKVVDLNEIVTWKNLTYDAYIPLSSGITFYTRSGNILAPDLSWSDWQPVNSSILSPDSRYIQYKAEFTTGNDTLTPELYSVTITYDDILPKTGERINIILTSIAAFVVFLGLRYRLVNLLKRKFRQ